MHTHTRRQNTYTLKVKIKRKAQKENASLADDQTINQVVNMLQNVNTTERKRGQRRERYASAPMLTP